MQTVVGVVGSVEQAESAIVALQSSGFARNDVSALFPDKRATADTAGDTVSGIESVLGTTMGLLAGITALVSPVGPFVAAGPLVAALKDSSDATPEGSIAGVLEALGLPESKAEVYENEVREGRILLAVKVESADERERASTILERADAHEIGVATA